MAKGLLDPGVYGSSGGNFLQTASRWVGVSRVNAAASASLASPSASDAADASAPGPAGQFRDLRTIALVSIQLALALVVIHQFQLESRTFFHVMLLGTVGFITHALLPLRYRLSFFALLSLASITVALGPLDGISLVVLGLVLIGICHVPVRMAVRISLLLATGTLLAVWRMELLPAPWSVAIWPVLASMFMFRLALYLYTLKHDKKQPAPARTLAYFFMLPNVCFPLYPIIDYATFVRTYYDRDAGRIYETGMKWIVRGLVHLILYRFVYLQLAGDPSELVTLGDLVQFLVATFLLYLRVSGQFHIITGVLHLYGFRLPETHHLYYLASSFTDFWRRINIYWKDFMMKLVYYPSYFWLRRWGGNTALVGATVTVFLATWVLHSYQWFWLRGGFPLEPQDALFWGILGVLVVFGSLREMKRPRQRTRGRGPAWSAWLALRTVGTFAAICVLWSLWSADSMGGWLTMWVVAGNVAPGDLSLLAGLILGGLLVAGRAWSVLETDDATKRPFYRQSALTALLLGMLVVGNPSFYARLSPQLATTVASLQRSTLNAHDATLQHKGYYEKLDNVSRMSAQLWNIQAQRPAHWVRGLALTEAFRERNDFMRGDLRPGASIVFWDQPLTVNQWGMRDRDYPPAKPKGTYRIALLGPSLVMGNGVADGETFADFLEERLNQSPNGGANLRYEVLNFGVAGFSLLQQLTMLEERALVFEPDAVFITDSPHAKTRLVAHLGDVVARGIDIPFPGLDALVRETGVSALTDDGFPAPFESVRALLRSAGIRTRMPGREADRWLRLAGDTLVRWTLDHIAEATREHGAVPVFVALDSVIDPPARGVRALEDAAAAGFLVFDLLGLWRGRDQPALRISEGDFHANAAGNQLIAERLFELIQQHRSELRLGPAHRAALE